MVVPSASESGAKAIALQTLARLSGVLEFREASGPRLQLKPNWMLIQLGGGEICVPCAVAISGSVNGVAATGSRSLFCAMRPTSILMK